jgi:DNA-binding NarL/FixJ family response regulator
MREGRSAAVRVLVVDDHPMVREGLRSMLAGAEIEIVGEAGDGIEAVEEASRLTPDVILLDLELPDVHGLATLKDLRRVSPGTAVLVVTMHQDPALMRQAVQAGAGGYVLKGVGRRELVAAVRAVAHGESVLDPGLLRAALETETPTSAERRPSLTPVELELLGLMAEGLTNRQIGARMRWSHATVKKYVQRVLEKLGVPDRTRAAVEAVRRGLLA